MNKLTVGLESRHVFEWSLSFAQAGLFIKSFLNSLDTDGSGQKHLIHSTSTEVM